MLAGSSASPEKRSVQLDVQDGVATLALDPPDGRFDRATLDALAAACGSLAAEPDAARAVVVAPAGADLGVGWDEHSLAVAEAGGVGPPPLGAAFEALAALPQPTVCAVRGRALSAGLELALACDMRVAEEGVRLALPEVAAGRVPRGGGTQRLPRAVGRAQALRLLLTAAEIDASEALRIGLVTEVTPAGGAIDAARAVALRIAERGPVATRFAKEAAVRGLELPLQQALRLEHDLTVLLQDTADRDEGVRAFLERRPPRFEGR
jgi:enoyl-CoA hydratase/carnithine racemase